MKDRLQRFLDLEQLTPAKLADILDVQRSGLSHILSGRNKPGFDFINKLLIKFPSLNSEWLITGKGKVYKESLAAQIEKGNGPSNSEEPPKTLFAAEKEIISPVSRQAHLPENLIFENEPVEVHEKRTLKRVLMIYSDNSFIEYFPGEDK